MQFKKDTIFVISNTNIISLCAIKAARKGGTGAKTLQAFAMNRWEKNKKDNRRNDDRESEFNQISDQKRKKLKPVEKTKYRLRANSEEEDY